jgi:hypothetical protein
MNAKIAIAAIVLVLIALAAYMYAAIPSQTADTESTEVSANDVSVDIEGQYSQIIQEELASMSSEQIAYNNQVQEDIANDISVYYT